MTDASKRPSVNATALVLALVLLLAGIGIGKLPDGFGFGIPNLTLPFLPKSGGTTLPPEKVKVVSEESIVVDVVDKASPSVVTIGISGSARRGAQSGFDPFNPFGSLRQRGSTPTPTEEDIGSGFIVGADGLIVTNKHVVADTTATYRVITKDDKSFDVTKIYRDPVNDLAILKINANGLTPVQMGDSGKIKVGQLAIAIGTALGEFRNTVTTGVISGVGRGITAGSPYELSAERLDNVIQTSAAINPGNSGGPLFNSSGQVIGINTAVSEEGQNIGFALPINLVREAIDQFNKTGQFARPYLGVRYKVISKDVAILNDVAEGVYVLEVVDGSPARAAGIEAGDIITEIDAKKLTGSDAELAAVIGARKAGDTLKLTVYRDGKEMAVTVTLGSQE